MGGKLRIRNYPSSVNIPELTLYRTAVYVNATIWDQDNKEEVSERLARQSTACREYLKNHSDLKKTDTYTDRNTCRDFEREWLRLLDDAEARKFDAVLVTSFHNICTSYGDAEYIFNCFFIPAGIRVIVIEDDFDSKYDDPILYMQEQLSKWFSFKADQRPVNRFNEKRINRWAVPYGYIHVPDHEPQVIKDDETSKFVELIFRNFLAGNSVTEIASSLNQLHAMTPSHRKKELYQYHTADVVMWKSTQVKKIIQNPIYTGDFVAGRTKEKIKDGENTFRITDKEEWKVFPDYHEPYISKEQFKKCQRILDESRYENNHDGASAKRPFRNIFYCGECGCSMKTDISYRKDNVHYLATVCDSGKYDPEKGCKRYGIPWDEIKLQIDNNLKMEISNAQSAESFIKKITKSDWYFSKLDEIRRERESICVKKDKVSASYDGYTAEDYLEELKENKFKEEDFALAFSEDNPWIKTFAPLDPNPLPDYTKDIVKHLFEKIEVYRDGHIKVHFKNEKWKGYFMDYNHDAGENGGFCIWEEETEN